MTKFPISGGCLCGNVRYSVSGPAHCVIHCHCSMCRRSYASLVGTGASIEQKYVNIDKGAGYLTTHEDSPGVSRQFCSKCGCSLFFFADSLKHMVVYFPATLDGGVHPGHPEGGEHHSFVGSKVSWEKFKDNLPRHQESIGIAALVKENPEQT
jgi:hypothetical protein